MPECVPNDCHQPPEWQDRLSAGDTVSFRFPIAEEEGGPRPKARPCLVLDVAEIDGIRHALLAYGTSRRTAANRGLEVEVRNVAARAAAGLDRRTRFVGARRILVPVSDAGFVVCAARETSILGRLSGGELARLQKLRAESGADFAADVPSAGVPRPPQIARRGEGRRHRAWPWTATGPCSDRTCGSVLAAFAGQGGAA